MNPLQTLFRNVYIGIAEKLAELFRQNQAGASATGGQRGGFHCVAHAGASKTFKKNRRKELKLAAKRER